MRKRLLSAILGLLILSSVLNSCASDTQEITETSENASADENIQIPAENEEETVPEETALSDGLEDVNMDGYDFRILSCYFNNKNTWEYLIFDEMTGDPVNDQLYEAKQAIEGRFNMKFSVIDPGDDSAAVTAFTTSVTGGDNAFDMHIGKDYKTVDLGIQNLGYNLYNIEQFDFDKPWWPENSVNAFTLCGKLFAASNYASYCGIHWSRVMSFNKDLMDEMQMVYPYDIVREGNWTLDTLYTTIDGTSVDTNGNGSIDKGDTYALMGNGSFYYCLQEAVDLSVYKKDEAGLPYLDLNVDKLDTFVTKMRQIMDPTDYLDESDQYFTQNKTVFSFCQIRDAYNGYRLSDIRYGFLPHPKLDENQENYISCCTDCPWIIPKTVSEDQADIIGTVIEALSCYNYINLLPVYFESALKARLADSPDDSEMLQLIADTRTISFAYSFNKLTFNNVISDCIANGNNRPVASYIKSSQKVAQKMLDNLIKDYESMDQ